MHLLHEHSKKIMIILIYSHFIHNQTCTQAAFAQIRQVVLEPQPWFCVLTFHIWGSKLSASTYLINQKYSGGFNIFSGG